METEPRQQPIADKCADQADDQIADQPKSAALHHSAGEPSRDNSDDQDDEETLVGKVHGQPPSKTIASNTLTQAPNADNRGLWRCLLPTNAPATSAGVAI